jgi:hypothetical protein
MKLVIGITAAIVMATGAAHADSYTIERSGPANARTITITPNYTNGGKPAPQMSRTYIQDSNGNLRDPVTGWPKGRNY